MDELENAPLNPPQPVPEIEPGSMPPADLREFRTGEIDDTPKIQAREIPEPLRTPDSPQVPETPTPPGSPQVPPETPDSPQRPGTPDSPSSPDVPPAPDSPPPPDSSPSRDSAQVWPGAKSGISARDLPRQPITPKPRAIFITTALLALTLTFWFAASREGWLSSTNPLDVARAQLLDLDQGRWRAAYDLFSPRYRGQVPFETWRNMALTHSRMFRTRELRFDDDQQWNGGAALEAHLVAESGDRYLARFTLVYAGGHWWVDDLHWGLEPAARDQVRA